MIRKMSKRIMLAYMALRGDLEHELEALEAVGQLKLSQESLRKAMLNSQRQAEYWYKLWMQMGREFEAGQNMLIEKIDELRQKCGEWDGQTFLNGLAQEGFHNKFVEPAKHPAVPGFEGAQIECPPRPTPTSPT